MEDDPIPHGFNRPLERTGSHTGREQNKSNENEKRPSMVEQERRPVPGPQHSAPEKTRRRPTAKASAAGESKSEAEQKNEQHKTRYKNK
jgi:hypothetical protein